MLKTKRPGTFYHGWHIEVVRQGSEFCFQCYPPQSDFCNDASAHASIDAAWVAACDFVDRELAILAVMNCLTDWFDRGKISEAEYWNLTSFD